VAVYVKRYGWHLRVTAATLSQAEPGRPEPSRAIWFMNQWLVSRRYPDKLVTGQLWFIRGGGRAYRRAHAALVM